MAETNKAINHGVVLHKSKEVDKKVVLYTDYADDMAIMDNSRDGLQESTDLLAHYSSHAGLKINAKKTKIQMNGCQQMCLPASLHRGGLHWARGQWWTSWISQ